tara:strand:- start:549 stop:806 length:258 start_codon:yes stop_codon:yes gene_type:complete
VKKEVMESYWKSNVRLVLILLFVWFSVSFLAGIVFLDFLNQFRLFGYKLGFWFSTQGSIYAFVILIFFYAWCMNKIDERHGVEEK